jgi:hypothetical protein
MAYKGTLHVLKSKGGAIGEVAEQPKSFFICTDISPG